MTVAGDAHRAGAGIEREIKRAQPEVRVDARGGVDGRLADCSEQRHLQPAVFLQQGHRPVQSPLQQPAGLRLLARNYRTPGRGGGEIDLIMRDRDGTLVFVEVRQRSRRDFGGAGASVGGIKQRRIVLAARHYLLRLTSPPPCRFDVLLFDGALHEAEPTWLRAAFDAS